MPYQCECDLPSVLLLHGAMGGLLFQGTGIMEYWPAMVLSVCFPNCMMWYGLSFTDMNVKLGGPQEGPLGGCMLGCCCSCCVLSRNLEAMDAATGQTTGCLKVWAAGGARELGMSVPMANSGSAPAQQYIQ